MILFLSSVDGPVIISGPFPQLVHKLLALPGKRSDFVMLQLLFQQSVDQTVSILFPCQNAVHKLVIEILVQKILSVFRKLLNIFDLGIDIWFPAFAAL